MIRLALVLMASLAVFAACGDEEEQPATATATPEQESYVPPDVSADLDKEPTVPKPEGDPPTELLAKDVVKGDGKTAKAGDRISVQYTGVSFSTGTKFDASWDRGAQPFQFNLGAGEVIPGWDQGVEGMKVGGRRVLVIPPDLAYGQSGQPPVIAPNETLIFVVDLVKVA